MIALKLRAMFATHPDEFSEKTRAEGIHFIYQNLPSLSLAILLLPLVITFLLWGEVDNTTLILWMLLFIIVSLTRSLLAKRYMEAKPTLYKTFHWGRYFSYTSFASGIACGLTPVLFLNSSTPTVQLVIFIFIFGMVNGSAFVTSYWLESFYTFMLTTFGITASYLFLQADPAYTAIAVLCLINAAMAFVIGGITNQAVLSSIQLRFENAELIQQLTESIKKAEDANQRKTRFLASASHDLRQPVHALGLFSEVLSTENLTSSGRDTLSFLKQSIVSLSGLLNSLLDISRLDAGIITPMLSAVDLPKLMQHLSNDFKAECVSKGLKCRTHFQPTWVHSDSTLLENILRNLLSNAVRYTNKGGILFSCRQRNNEVWIDIWDTGIGISIAEQDRVFDEFYQINNPERDRQQGLGLGLAIVHKQVQLLNHQLSLVSHLGKGSHFRLKLEPANPSNELVIDRLATTQQLIDRRILIIDDDDAILIGMRMTLEAWKCQVFTASNLDKAITICEQIKPDIIIADFRLRDHMTGIDIVQHLRKQLKQKIPALLITGDTAPDRLQQAQQSDLILIHKPVQPAKLRAALNLL